MSSHDIVHCVDRKSAFDHCRLFYSELFLQCVIIIQSFDLRLTSLQSFAQLKES
jgi:hypothetical protein